MRQFLHKNKTKMHKNKDYMETKENFISHINIFVIDKFLSKKNILVN